jgi:hypothetical protein
MVGTALLIIAMSMVAFATVLHFWIYVRLESAGIVVEYFTTARKAYRTYRVYRQVAGRKGWPEWPGYAVLILAYSGLAMAAISMFFDSPMVRLMHSVNSH